MIRPRIIVTGATGKTGSVVVTELLKVLAQQMQSSQSVLGMRKPASILSICLVAALFSAAAWAQQSESARSLSAPSVDWIVEQMENAQSTAKPDVVSAEGIESTQKRIFNNIQGNGRHFR